MSRKKCYLACDNFETQRVCRGGCGRPARKSQHYCDDDTCRFWHKVQKGPGCWLWTASRSGNGQWYGQFTTAGVGKSRRHVGAHVYSYELAHGPVPKGRSVLHACDDPSCVNPDHLFLGTQADNVQDASRKGRYAVPRPKSHKLTAEQIASVREQVARGPRGTATRLAAELGVTKTHISLLVRGLRRQYDAPLSVAQRKAS